jgi:hypothetical protein
MLFDLDGAGVVTNLIVLFDLNSSLGYDGDMELIRPRRGNPRLVKCHWRKGVILQGVVDPRFLVSPEYSKPEDLPLDEPNRERSGENENQTGTDNGD